MKFVIDESKWRCGMRGKPGCRLGVGNTYLLNEKKFMCCLGQMCLQLGVPEEKIRLNSSPTNVRDVQIKYLKNREGYDSELSEKAMEINDDQETTVEEKKRKLRSLFKRYRHQVVFTKGKKR